MAAFGALAIMRCLGKKSEGPAITLTRVNCRSDYAARNYSINQGVEIDYEYHEEYYDTHVMDSNEDENDFARNVLELNQQNSIIEGSENTSIHSYIEGVVIPALVRSTSSDATQNTDDMTSQNGVILISIHHYGDDVPQADDSNQNQNQTTRQFSSTESVTLSRSTRGGTRSYEVIQESHDNPSDDVLSMRLARNVLSEELMSRHPPSYERIVDLTDGAYVKPLPPSYDSIFQTNKM